MHQLHRRRAHPQRLDVPLPGGFAGRRAARPGRSARPARATGRWHSSTTGPLSEGGTPMRSHRARTRQGSRSWRVPRSTLSQTRQTGSGRPSAACGPRTRAPSRISAWGWRRGDSRLRWHEEDGHAPVVANSALMFAYLHREWRQMWEGWTYVDTLSDTNRTLATATRDRAAYREGAGGGRRVRHRPASRRRAGPDDAPDHATDCARASRR